MKLTNDGKHNFLDGTRILTEDEIADMSDGSLKLYHRRAKKLKHWVNQIEREVYCEYCGEVISQRELTPEEVKLVSTASYLKNATRREVERRQNELGR